MLQQAQPPKAATSAVVGGRILANTDTFYTPTLIMLATSLVYKDSSLQRNFHLCRTLDAVQDL